MSNTQRHAETPRQRLLLVGAGRRIQNSFLPVLQLLRDRFVVCGVHSRTALRREPVAQAWNISAVASLQDVDFTGIDVVAMSVPAASNADVLRQLLPHAGGLHLVIDTPVAITRDQHLETTPLLAAFRAVTVTEDYMNFPNFRLIRQASQSGMIGRPRTAILTNIGFLFHGLALIRSFTGFMPVESSWRQPVGRRGTIIGYRFRRGFEGVVIGPYRRHTTGGMTLEGTEGTITEFPADATSGNAGRPVYVIQARMQDRLISGYEITDVNRRVVLAEDLPDVAALRAMPIHDKSDLNLLRGCSLKDVFLSVADIRNLNSDYGYRNALYDSVVSRSATDGRTPLDPYNLLEPVTP